MLPYDLMQVLVRQTRDAEERSDRVYEAVIGLVVDNKDLFPAVDWLEYPLAEYAQKLYSPKADSTKL